MIDYPPEETWPQIGRGGHLRNAKGQALVIPPGGGRHRIALGGSNLDVFEPPYDGNPIYGDQGTHVHTATEWADAGRPVDADLIAAGEACGLDEATTRHIWDSYTEFIGRLGWSTVLTECVVVNDRYCVPIASNIDKVMQTPDGRRVVVDVKSGKEYAKRAYALQAAAYVDADLYDPATGDRTPLGVDTEAACIFHYAVRGDRTWRCYPVDVAGIARPLLERFMALRDDADHLTAFGPQIASAPLSADDAPDDLLSVEHGTPDDGVVAVVGGPEPANPYAGKTLDELRAISKTWQPADTRELVDLIARNNIDKTDADAIAYAMHLVRSFGDVTTTPAPAPVPAETPTVAPKRPDVDEGATITAEAVKAAGARYLALGDDVRSWVTVTGGHIRMSGVNGRPTERRRLLLAGLCELAENGFHDDGAVAAIAAHCGLGDAAYRANTAADVMAAMDVNEAAQFAAVAAVVTVAMAPFAWTDDGRCVLAEAVAA